MEGRREYIDMKILHGDCMEIMRKYETGYFDLAIVDPPYGIKRFSQPGHKLAHYGSHKEQWNNIKPTNEYFEELFRISKKQIIWGANNFDLPPSEYFIVWKKQGAVGNSFAMVEQAWTNVKKPAKIFEYLHVENQEHRFHPTQKPVALYKWLLENYSKPEHRIIDTHLGSGSSAIAAHYNDQREFVGIEIDEKYYNLAMNRISNETVQGKLI